MVSCINLNERFGDRYRLDLDPAFYEEYGRNARIRDPWYWRICCQHGHVYPHGGTRLGASSNCRGPIANSLAALSCVRVVQDGDDGINVVFDVSDFDQVAAILKPRRRRRLSPEQVAERTERLRKYQFSPASQDAHSDRRRDPTAPADTEAA